MINLTTFPKTNSLFFQSLYLFVYIYIYFILNCHGLLEAPNMKFPSDNDED